MWYILTGASFICAQTINRSEPIINMETISRRLKIATWVGSVATVALSGLLVSLAYHTQEHRTRGYVKYEKCLPRPDGDRYHYKFSDIDGIQSIKLYGGSEEVFSLRVPRVESQESLSNQHWTHKDDIPVEVNGCLGLSKPVTHFVVTDLKGDDVEFFIPLEKRVYK